MHAHAARKTLARLGATMTLVALNLTALVTTAHAATLPTAVYAKTSDWGGGFAAGYTITNTMTVPLNSWKIVFTLPATEKITSLWNAQLSVSGNTYTAT